MFPDEMFADVFSDRGRRSVPPCVVATIVELQRLEGLATANRSIGMPSMRVGATPPGVGGYDGDGWARFAHTVFG